MVKSTSLGEVLDAIDRLPLDEQHELMAIVRRRLAEAGRRRILADVQEAEAEIAAGGSRPASVEEIMRDILG